MKKSIIIIFTIFLFTIYTQFQYSTSYFEAFAIDTNCPWCDVNAKDDMTTYLPLDHRVLKILGYADPDFLADLLWMYLADYYGKETLTSEQFFYLYSLIDNISLLSPRWDFPYYFAGTVFLEAGELSTMGLILLDKGLSYLPDDWSLWFLKGYHLWKKSNDIENAAIAFEQSALKTGAPAYLSLLSATLLIDASKKTLAEKYLKRTLHRIKNPILKRRLLDKFGEINPNE